MESTSPPTVAHWSYSAGKLPRQRVADQAIDAQRRFRHGHPRRRRERLFRDAKGGNGTLALTGVNTYLGTTNLTRGRLQIGNDNQLGNAAATVTATSPGLLEITGDMTTSRGITLNNSAMLQVDAGKTLTLSGARIDGGFLIGPGTIATTGSNPSVFSGGARRVR